MTILRLDLFRVFFTAQCDQVKFGRPPDADMQNADDKMQVRKTMRHYETRLETLPKAQRTRGLSSYRKITVHSSQILNIS